MNRTTLQRILADVDRDPRLAAQLSQRVTPQAKDPHNQGFSLILTLRGGHRVLKVESWLAWVAIKSAWRDL